MKTPRSFQALMLSALSLLLLGRADASECFSNREEGGTPVCGSDGLTYANECDLQYHSCLNPGVLSPEPFDCTLGEAMNTLFGTADSSLSGSDGSSSSDADQGSDFPEGPMGGTLSFDEPDFDGVIPGQATKPSDADSSSSSSSSSDGDDDSFPDFDASPTLPPGVVIDPNAPSALDFIPTTTLSSDNGKNSEGDHDFFEDTVFDSSIWVVTSKGSSSSSSGESSSESSSDASSGSGDSDDNDASHCEMMCMSRYEPVCASNGATYSNSCELKVAQCSDPKLTFAHPGPCPPYPVAPPPLGGSYDACAYLCPMFSAPVCSEDGHIYDNKCVYASALCRDSTLEDATAELCETL